MICFSGTISCIISGDLCNYKQDMEEKCWMYDSYSVVPLGSKPFRPRFMINKQASLEYLVYNHFFRIGTQDVEVAHEQNAQNDTNLNTI